MSHVLPLAFKLLTDICGPVSKAGTIAAEISCIGGPAGVVAIGIGETLLCSLDLDLCVGDRPRDGLFSLDGCVRGAAAVPTAVGGGIDGVPLPTTAAAAKGFCVPDAPDFFLPLATDCSRTPALPLYSTADVISAHLGGGDSVNGGGALAVGDVTGGALATDCFAFWGSGLGPMKPFWKKFLADQPHYLEVLVVTVR